MNWITHTKQFFAITLLLLGTSHAFAGAVNPSSTSCASYSSFSVDAFGNLSIQCAGGGGTTPQLPSCSLTPGSQSISAGGTATLSASCVNPSTVNWTNAQGGAIFSSTGGNAVFSTPGSYTYSVNNGSASATATVNVAATSTGPVQCAQANTNTLYSYSSNQSVRVVNNNGQSRSIQFTTPGVGYQGAAAVADDPIGLNVPTFVNISEKQCDFSYTNLDNYTGCASTGMTNKIYYHVVNDTTVQTNTCSLKPNTTYFMNIRNENAIKEGSRGQPSQRGQDSCALGELCGFIWQIQ